MNPERSILLERDEVEINNENLDYKDLVNLLSGRISPTSLKQLFPMGINEHAIVDVYLDYSLLRDSLKYMK